MEWSLAETEGSVSYLGPEKPGEPPAASRFTRYSHRRATSDKTNKIIYIIGMDQSSQASDNRTGSHGRQSSTSTNYSRPRTYSSTVLVTSPAGAEEDGQPCMCMHLLAASIRILTASKAPSSPSGTKPHGQSGIISPSPHHDSSAWTASSACSAFSSVARSNPRRRDVCFFLLSGVAWWLVCLLSHRYLCRAHMCVSEAVRREVSKGLSLLEASLVEK